MYVFGGKYLSEGILLEDNGHFFKWNRTIRSLRKENIIKEESAGDRTIYYWGKHQVFNGLDLELFSFYWNHKLESINKRFNSIEFKVVGDKVSESYFDLIKNHIDGVFGKGIENILSDADKSVEWNRDGVKLYLLLFEQFVYKLSFRISKE